MILGAATPVIIIGAARSGTNMLRELLTHAPGFETWPCDEINYIWRHGNRMYPSDEFSPGHATPSVKTYIRNQFNRLAGATGASTIVEKTCANSLRVGFVDAVVPEARFVFLYRDGRDVVASALKRWRAPFDASYILAKARYVPASDVPYYASRYALNRLHRLFSREKRLAFWGPRFNGMDAALRRHSLAQVAAMQWARSIERSLEAFACIDPARVVRVGYEDLASNPRPEAQRIFDFLEVNSTAGLNDEALHGLSSRSIGRWQEDLDESARKEIEPIVEPALTRLGCLSN